MEGSLQRSLDGLAGVTALTRRGAETIVRTLVQSGEVAADRAERAVDELLARSERNRAVVADLVRQETERVVDRLGLARQEDLDALTARIARLEAALAAGEAEPHGRPSVDDPSGVQPDLNDPSGVQPDLDDPSGVQPDLDDPSVPEPEPMSGPDEEMPQ